MRLPLLLLVACSSGAKPPAAPVANVVAHSCADAALGLENATRGVRAPDQDVFDALRARCTAEAWPAVAIDCFATMEEGDLGRCSRKLNELTRDGLFAALSGNEPSRAGLAVVRARLDGLQVGVAECDRFIGAVAAVLTCEAMPLDTRVQLGSETADFWSLPTNRLSADDRNRISSACGRSLASLQQQAFGIGCMP